MGIYDDPYGDAYNGPGNGAQDPNQAGVPEGWEWDPQQGQYVPAPSVIGAPPVQTAAPPTAPTTPTGSTGGYSNDTRGIADAGAGAGTTDLTAPFTDTFKAPPVRFPGATGNGVPETPRFTAPGYKAPPAFSYRDWTPTTTADVLGDTGFQFGLDQGLGAMKASKAAGGIYNTGGTLKDFIQYGTNYGLSRFSDVDTRRRNDYTMGRGNAVQDYNINYGTQYQDPYAIAYRGATDEFAPQMTAFGTNAAANQRSNELDYSRAYDDDFLFNYKKFLDQRDSTFNKRWTVASA